YTVTVTGTNGCTSTASITITQGAGVPTVGYTASATTVCAGTAVTLSGTGADTYTWTGGITNGVSFIPTATASYTVTGTVTIGGCSNAETVTITVVPRPTGNISGAASICLGASTNLSIAVTGNGPWNGTLSDGTIFSGSSTPITVTVSPLTNTVYTISTLSASSCPAQLSNLTGSASITLNSFAVPDTIVGSRNACLYSATSTLNATYSIAATNASAYAWTMPAGATLISGAGTNTITVHYASTFTTGTISVQVSSNCGSPITKTTSITKTLSAAPASISGPTSVCAYIGTSTQATYSSAVVAGAIKYSWTLPSTVTIVSATSDSSSINVTFGVSYVTSTFSVKAVVGCGTTAAKTLSVTGTTTAPVAGTANTRCGVGLISFSATPGAGETIDWYSAATAGILLRSASTTFDSTFTTTGTKTLYAAARNSANGCLSATRTAVTAIINALPTAVTVSVSASGCGTSSVTLSATVPASTTLSWFADSSTIGTVLGTGATFTTPVISATTKYFVASQSTTNSCFSTSLKSAIATINTVPDLTTVNTTQSRCGTGSIILTATAPTGSAVWFHNAVGGTALTTATTATVTYATPVTSASDSTYYVATKSTAGCFSARTSVLAKINALPAAPATSGTSRCGTGTVTVSATPGAGETINWYSAATAGTLLASASNTYSPVSISATTTYYAEINNGTCNSVRSAAVATVNALPAVSTGVPTSRCGAGAVTVSATPLTGMTIDWYSASTAGTLLLSGSNSYTTTITATTSFYAATRNLTTGCVSATPTAVAATLNALPATVATVTAASRCGTDTATLKATAAASTTIDWYADTLRTSLIQSGTVTGVNSYLTPVASSTTTYWVVGRNLTTGCVSAASKPVALTINAVPGLPTVNTTQSRCGTGSIILTATAPTGSAVWFRNATITTALTTATTATVTYTTLATSANDSTYYVATKSTAGCFSARTAVLAKINAVPTAPTTSGTSVCGISRATVSAATTVAGGTIDWYSATTSGTLLRSNSLTFDSLITATKTFYALTRVTTTGCLSATRTAAVATYIALLAAPTTLTGTTSICPIVGTTTGATYTATAVTGAVSYQWTIPAGAVLDSGSNGLKIKIHFVTAGPVDSIYVQAIATTGCAGTKKVLKLVTTSCVTLVVKPTITAAESISVNVFPNPTTNSFNVRVVTAGKEVITARIYDVQGRFIKSVIINPYETINIGSELKAGTYMVEVRQGKNLKTTRVLKF
ncbi:MAG: T9SS type A sorting domain-containing protein, partial [Bacteroidota bacterium]